MRRNARAVRLEVLVWHRQVGRCSRICLLLLHQGPRRRRLRSLRQQRWVETSLGRCMGVPGGHLRRLMKRQMQTCEAQGPSQSFSEETSTRLRRRESCHGLRVFQRHLLLRIPPHQVLLQSPLLLPANSRGRVTAAKDARRHQEGVSRRWYHSIQGRTMETICGDFISCQGFTCREPRPA